MIIHCQIHDMRDAWLSLRRRPLRSLLSSIGIGIGVSALIAMLSIGEGARRAALDKITSLGVNTLRIENTGLGHLAGGEGFANMTRGLVREDAQSLKSWLGNRGYVGAYARVDDVTVFWNNSTVQATLLGVSGEWFNTESIVPERGRLLSEDDIVRQEKICVTGSSVAKTLGSGNGAILRIDGQPVVSVGLLPHKGKLLTEGTGLSSLDFDNTVIVPISLLPSLGYNKEIDHLDGIVMTMRDGRKGMITDLASQVKELLTVNHHRIEDFTLVVPVNLLEEEKENQRLFSLIMGAIAGLSLLVGGIGVMNVMLANIAEQTREIGLRMAMGASRIRIVSLYLWNAVLLTLSGGIWGIGSGIFLALAIQKYGGWDVVISSFSLMIAPFSAIVAGIIFGVHPAVRAASLSPALALRDS